MSETAACKTAQRAATGKMPMPLAARHEPTASWVAVDAAWLDDVIESLRDVTLSDMGSVRDELGWEVCGCMDCEIRKTIAHLLPRILLAAEDGLVGIHRTGQCPVI